MKQIFEHKLSHVIVCGSYFVNLSSSVFVYRTLWLSDVWLFCWCTVQEKAHLAIMRRAEEIKHMSVNKEGPAAEAVAKTSQSSQSAKCLCLWIYY